MNKTRQQIASDMLNVLETLIHEVETLTPASEGFHPRRRSLIGTNFTQFIEGVVQKHVPEPTPFDMVTSSFVLSAGIPLADPRLDDAINWDVVWPAYQVSVLTSLRIAYSIAVEMVEELDDSAKGQMEA